MFPVASQDSDLGWVQTDGLQGTWTVYNVYPTAPHKPASCNATNIFHMSWKKTKHTLSFMPTFLTCTWSSSTKKVSNFTKHDFFFFFFYWAEGLPSPNDCKPRLAGIDPSPYPPLWVKSTRSVGKLNHVVRMPAVRLIIPRQPETLQNPTTNKKREEKKDTERWYSWHVPITLGNF